MNRGYKEQHTYRDNSSSLVFFPFFLNSSSSSSVFADGPEAEALGGHIVRSLLLL